MENEDKMQEYTAGTSENVQKESESKMVNDAQEPSAPDEGSQGSTSDTKEVEVKPVVSAVETESEPVADLQEVTITESHTEEVVEENGDKSEENSSEEETIEAQSSEEETEEEVIDLSEASINEVLEALKEIRNEEDGRKLDRVLKEAKPRFDELYELEKNEALQKYVSEGNEADGFDYHGNNLDKEFYALHNVLRARRNKFFKDLEASKDNNLKVKEGLLDQLREIVDGEESESSFNKVRALQEEWKKVGPVPGAQNKTLWANYNALLDRFYDNRSIYFELKDLDRKKNLELKSDLCAKAESLAKLEDIKEAVMQLNDLHEEYKHVGPVPKEDQEPLWLRFKAASDEIYSKRKVFFDELKVQFEENLEKKKDLIKELTPFLSFTSDKITEWNKQTKDILALQKKWEAIGGIPRDKAKSINKEFWNSFKSFFSNKNKFFKTLESQRDENLLKKEELIQQAEELKDSTDFVATADKFKSLQSKWKEIGPVPEKVRNEVYARFKGACDHFFNRRRSQNEEQNKVFEENLSQKMQVCDQLNEIGNAETFDLDNIYDLVDHYSAIGFVPKNAIRKIQRRFDDAINRVLENANLNDFDRQDLKKHIQTSRLRSSPGGERKIHRKENSIKRKISSIENDINTYKTNMQFFAKSSNADKLKAEFEKKIANAEIELSDLKRELFSLSQ